jgi:hypothetical protein
MMDFDCTWKHLVEAPTKETAVSGQKRCPGGTGEYSSSLDLIPENVWRYRVEIGIFVHFETRFRFNNITVRENIIQLLMA